MVLPVLLGAATTAAAGTLTYAALAPQSQIFGPTLVAPKRPDEIALTFDDGPNPAATPRLLEALARHNTRATFFLLGKFAQAQPELAREIASAGHLIGSHSMTHPWLLFISGTRMRQEIGDSKAAIEDILGVPVRFFRAPHGARCPYVLRAIREMGLTPVQWNIICGDWNPISAETILARATRGIARNERKGRATNLVLHDGGHLALNADRLSTVEAVDRLLQRFSTSKKFVTVDEWIARLP